MSKREHWIRTLPGVCFIQQTIQGSLFKAHYRFVFLAFAFRPIQWIGCIETQIAIPICGPSFTHCSKDGDSIIWLECPDNCSICVICWLTKILWPCCYLDNVEIQESSFLVLIAIFPLLAMEKSLESEIWTFGRSNFKISVNFITGQNSLFSVLWKFRMGFTAWGIERISRKSWEWYFLGKASIVKSLESQSFWPPTSGFLAFPKCTRKI